jgi:sugar/nucleoside kinase (ribokinase family)
MRSIPSIVSALLLSLLVSLLCARTAVAGEHHAGLGILGDAHAPDGQPQIDVTLPAMKARDLTGRSFDFGEALEAGPVLLVVWFSDCPTCPRALLRLLEWASQQQEVPVVVGVNGDPAQARAWLRPFLKRSDLELTVLADADGDLRRGLGLEQSPAVVMMRRDDLGTHLVLHQPSEQLSMDRLARGWIDKREAELDRVAAR